MSTIMSVFGGVSIHLQKTYHNTDTHTHTSFFQLRRSFVFSSVDSNHWFLEWFLFVKVPAAKDGLLNLKHASLWKGIYEWPTSAPRKAAGKDPASSIVMLLV